MEGIPLNGKTGVPVNTQGAPADRECSVLQVWYHTVPEVQVCTFSDSPHFQRGQANVCFLPVSRYEGERGGCVQWRSPPWWRHFSKLNFNIHAGDFGWLLIGAGGRDVVVKRRGANGRTSGYRSSGAYRPAPGAGVAPGVFRLRPGVRGVFDVAEIVRQESVAREGIRPAQRSRGSSCPLEPVVPPRVGRRRQPERPTSSFLVIVRYG